jgi:hypothetical protein
MPTLQQVFGSADFYKLSDDDKYAVIKHVEPKFSALSDDDQKQVLEHLSTKWGPSPGDELKAAHEPTGATKQPEVQPQSQQESQPPQQGESLTDKVIGGAKSIGRQIMLNPRYIVEGAAEVAAPVANAMNWGINKVLPSDHQLSTDFAGDVSKLVDKTGLPSPEGETENTVAKISRAVAGAGLTAGAAGALAPVLKGTSGAVAGSLAEMPAQQIVGAASGAGAQDVAERSGAGKVGQAAAAIAGGVAGAGLSNIKLSPKNVASSQAVKDAETLGINVPTSDVFQPKTFVGKSAQTVSERIPYAGTGKMRKGQYEQRVDAIKKVAGEFGVDENSPILSDSVMKDLSYRRVADIKKYSGWKEDIVKRSKNYGTVNVDRTIPVIDNEIDRLKSISEKGYKSAVELLENFKADIQGNSLENIEGNRRLLGNQFKAQELSSVRDEGQKSVAKIYDSLRSDINKYVLDNGGKKDLRQWQTANGRLSEMLGELENSSLKAALKKGDATPETINRLLLSKKPSDVRLLYRNLDNRGKANARAAIIQDVVKKSGGFEELSTAKFATNVKKAGESIGVFFTGDDLKKIEGLSRALSLTKRAEIAGLHPPTGVQNNMIIGGAVLTDMLGSGGAAAASAASIGGLARVIESRTVRNMLMKLPSLKKGSPEEAAIAKRLFSTIQTIYEADKDKKRRIK